MRTAKTLIRLGRCPGRSESSLDIQVILLALSCGSSYASSESSTEPAAAPSLLSLCRLKLYVPSVRYMNLIRPTEHSGWSASDAAICGIWQGSTLFAYKNFYLKQNKNRNGNQTPLNLEWTWPADEDGRIHQLCVKEASKCLISGLVWLCTGMWIEGLRFAWQNFHLPTDFFIWQGSWLLTCWQSLFLRSWNFV